MTKVKLILGGVAGAVGLTGAALVPSLLTSSADPTSENKVDSGGKAVPKSWATGVNKGAKFNSFGTAFAPFLVDVDKTDNAFWKKRVGQTKSKEFDDGKIFSGWHNISDEKLQIERIKSGCKEFQNLALQGADATDIRRMMDLCGIHDPEQGKSQLLANTSSLTSSNESTAETVCGLLNVEEFKKKCKEFNITQ